MYEIGQEHNRGGALQGNKLKSLFYFKLSYIHAGYLNIVTYNI